MNFLLVLCASVIEWTLASMAGLRSSQWSGRWLNWLSETFASQSWWRGWLVVGIVIGVPLVVVGAGFALVFEMSALLGHLASLAFLLWLLGPSDLNQEVDRYRSALRPTGESGAEAEPVGFVALGETLDLGPASGDPQFDASRADLAGLALAADRSWYQPLFWFCLCGPLGAFAYRLCANLAADPAGEASVTSAMTQAREIMEALPARLTAVAFGIAGSLVPVLVTVREIGVLRWGASSELRARAALAAIDNGRVDQVAAGDVRIYHLNLMHALVRRTLVVWLVFLAIGTLLVF